MGYVLTSRAAKKRTWNKKFTLSKFHRQVAEVTVILWFARNIDAKRLSRDIEWIDLSTVPLKVRIVRKTNVVVTEIS